MGIYLCSQDIVHWQYVYRWVDRERSLDLGTDDLRTLQFKQLFGLVLGGGGTLERDVSGSTVCIEVRLIRIFGRDDSVRQGGTDKAVRLTIPEQRLGLVNDSVYKMTHMISGRKVAATGKTFLPPPQPFP